MMHHSRQQGFTLLEVAISLGILAILGTLAFVSFRGTRTEEDLITTGQSIISVMRLAQARSLAGEGDSQWGVRLEPARYILFRGPSSSGATLTNIYPLPGALTLTNIALIGGGQEVVFDRLEGTAAQSGSFNVQAPSTGDTFSIVMDASGKAYRAADAPISQNTRVIDTRHRNFSLGWSIQNATTLTLTFSDPPNPNTVTSIPTAAYFNAGKTIFDWSGSVSVGGENQILRIHTILLNGSVTTLSTDRDCRTNTKGLNIKIDANDIATYSADCQSVTVGPMGGTVSEP